MKIQLAAGMVGPQLAAFDDVFQVGFIGRCNVANINDMIYPVALAALWNAGAEIGTQTPAQDLTGIFRIGLNAPALLSQSYDRIPAPGQASLFGGKASLDGVGKHLADGRVLILSYFSLALPTAFTLIDLAVFGKIPLATLAASTEEFMLSCPQRQADYKRRNTIWLTGLGAMHPKLLCAKPVTKLSDLKGLKISTSGGLGCLAKAMGAVPVGMNLCRAPARAT